MKFLLLGKNGQLGRAILKRLATKNQDFAAFSKGELDIADATELARKLQEFQPTVVINCAAYNDVNAAEQDSAQALETNYHAVSKLTTACERVKAKLVHFSSDYVFDGSKRQPYIETDPTSPINQYGISKVLGEQALSSSSIDYLLLRTSWVYGDGKRNFIYRLNQWAKNNETLRIVEDEQSVPTSADDLANLTLECIEKEISGTFHGVNSGSASRFEFAKAIKSSTPSFQASILPANSTAFASDVSRPQYSVLSPSKLEDAIGHAVPHWTNALVRFLGSRKSGRD